MPAPNYPLSLRPFIALLSLLVIWKGLVIILKTPPYILPSPETVCVSFVENFSLLLTQALPTLFEIFLGFLFGSILGILSALIIACSKPIRIWLLPILLISQSLPMFALAPLLVVWFGYGITTKIIATIIMIFFPITNAFYDGLQTTNPTWLDLSYLSHASIIKTFWHIKIPAALPSLATGLRMAAAIAPIGAIVSEWVGSNRGLGYLMLYANARMQMDLMFSALFITLLITLTFYFLIDKLLRIVIPWEKWPH